MVFSRSCKLLVLYHSQARYFINIHEPPIRYLARRCQASYLINQDLPLSGFYAVNVRLCYSWVALIGKLDDLLVCDCISEDARIHLRIALYCYTPNNILIRTDKIQMSCLRNG